MSGSPFTSSSKPYSGRTRSAGSSTLVHTNPWRHWEGSGRPPPYDIAATSVPDLGPYHSGNPRVLEQHARWIAESGAGAINVSWWGRDDYEDRLVPLLMDVMRDHGLKVTFHLEPYGDNRIDSFASDICYLVTDTVTSVTGTASCCSGMPTARKARSSKGSRPSCRSSRSRVCAVRGETPRVDLETNAPHKAHARVSGIGQFCAVPVW